MKSLTSLKKWGALFVLLSFSTIQAQTYQRATSTFATLNVDNPNNAIDASVGDTRGDLTTFSNIRANSGVAAGLGAYDGLHALEFQNVVPGGTTTYFKIGGNTTLVQSLLGGSAVGQLLSSVLLGNQTLTFAAFDASQNPVIVRTTNQLNNQDAKVVSNASGEYFLALTPPQDYKYIQIYHDLTGVVGLLNETQVYFYGAFHNASMSTCEPANYTSWSAAGGLLDVNLLSTGGVNNPENVIDSNPTNYSELILPTLSIAGSVQQTVYFNGNSNSTYNIRLSSTADILNLNLADNIQIIGYNGSTEVSSVSLSTLLDLDLLGLFQSNNIISFPFTPGGAIDRVSVRVSSLANVSLTSSLRLYSITRDIPELETFSATNIDTDGATLNAGLTNNTCLSLYGFEYSTDPDFAQGTGTQVLSTNLGTGTTFSYDLSGLNANETYYFRAFATVSSGSLTYDVYGDLESFSTDIITWNGGSWNNVNGPNSDGSDDVLIAGNYDSSLNGGGFAVDSLFINTGNALTIKNNDDLEIYGNIDAADDNSIDAQEGMISWLGDDTQVLDGNEFVANTINIVEVDKPDNIILEAFNEINIVDNFTITNGDLDLNENSNLVFKSTATQTAIFGLVGDCANTIITYSGSGATQGKVTVERFIPANRAFRGLTAPVNSTTTINDNWQEGAQNLVPDYSSNQNPEPGYGTHITGNDPTTNGFDNTATDNPSLFTYDNTSQSWVTITNTDENTFSVGEPYFMLVRGDRSVNTQTNAPTPTNTTLRASGQLHLCDFSFTANLSSTANAFNFVGNPYQSPVDIESALNSSTNLNQEVYLVYDPNINTNGGYSVVDLSDNSTTPPSNANQYLQPGQAAYVYTDSDGGAASLTFLESHKYTLTTNEDVFRPSNNNSNQQYIRLNLYNESGELIDGVKLNFDNSSTYAIDNLDIFKPQNFDETLGVLNNGEIFMMTSDPLPTSETSYVLDITKYRENNYSFEIILSNMSAYEIALKDNYLSQTSSLNNQTNFHSFSIDLSDNSSNANRFELVIESENLSQENWDDHVFTISPNPVTNNNISLISSQLNGENVDVKIYSMFGQQVYADTKSFNSNQLKINIEKTLNSGVYIININSGNKTYTQKLIVK